jgi:hypothetical protein
VGNGADHNATEGAFGLSSDHDCIPNKRCTLVHATTCVAIFELDSNFLIFIEISFLSSVAQYRADANKKLSG